MITDETSAELEIVQAAIECIEKYGIQKVTNRKVAEIAGVNSAAINYYFRSKDALVNRCMQVTLENAFDSGDFEKLPAGTAHERCTMIFEHLIEGGLTYPGITRAHLYSLLTEGRYDAMVVVKLNGFVERLVKDIEICDTSLNHEDLTLACVQMLLAVMMAILAPRLFAEKLGIDLSVEATRKRYVERLVGRLL